MQFPAKFFYQSIPTILMSCNVTFQIQNNNVNIIIKNELKD